MKNYLHQMTPLLKRKEMNEVVKVGYQITAPWKVSSMCKKMMIC
jgi:hypothetical protein